MNAGQQNALLRRAARARRRLQTFASDTVSALSRRIFGTFYTVWESVRGGTREAADIPVIINSFNRLSSLRALIEWLEKAGCRRIIILDNASTYAPLLEYYRTTSHEVVRSSNLGPYALWELPDLWRRVRKGFFVYTDSDIVPDEACPLDAIPRFLGILRWRLGIDKVGFGLRIDDLPDHYLKKSDVLVWEAKHWEKPVEREVYSAPLDTTFALYRPFAARWSARALRTGFPYVARHTTWYADSAAPTEEEIHYARTASKAASSWLEGHGVSYFGEVGK